jgi:hypothetical protein
MTEAQYPAYEYVLDVTCELLLRGNVRRQQVYVDVQPSPDEVATVFLRKPKDRDFLPKCKVGGEELYVWDAEFAHEALQGLRDMLWNGNSAPLTVEEGAKRVAQLAGFTLGTSAPVRARARFQIWARMFAACRRALPTLATGGRPWTMRTVFHGGWGTHYLFFSPLGASTEPFAISEEGHIAIAAVGDALGDFNLRRAAMRVREVEEIRDYVATAFTVLRRAATADGAAS